MLRLIRDLVALSNTGEGGYFVVGIDEGTCLPVGTDNTTFTHENEDLNEILNLYCSDPLPFFARRMRIQFDTEGVKRFKSFHVFLMPVHSGLTYIIRDGSLTNCNDVIFAKYDVPIRCNGRTVMADEEQVDRILIERDSPDIVSSITSRNLRKYEDLTSFKVTNRVPGELPFIDFEKIIGREEEMEKVIEFLNDPKVYSWTIDGIGGSGKSAIAKEIARNIHEGTLVLKASSDATPSTLDGLVWVEAKSCDLDPGRGIVPKFGASVTLEILLDKISDIIGLPELKYVEFEERMAILLEFLPEYNLLIFIDNLETIPDTHLSEVMEFVEKKLPKPSKVIYTTRTRLFEGHSSKVMELRDEAAVIFCKKIALDHGDLTLARDREVIRRVVERSGGIPQGIKWAMSQVCLGYSLGRSVDKLFDDDVALIRYCFEDIYKCLEPHDQITLFAIAVCDFTPDVENIEFLTDLPKGVLRQCIDKL